MFVRDNKIQDHVRTKKVYTCSQRFGRYLIDKYDMPLLSIVDDKYVFSFTHELAKTLNNIPKLVKIFYVESGDIIG